MHSENFFFAFAKILLLWWQNGPIRQPIQYLKDAEEHELGAAEGGNFLEQN